MARLSCRIGCRRGGLLPGRREGSREVDWLVVALSDGRDPRLALLPAILFSATTGGRPARRARDLPVAGQSARGFAKPGDGRSGHPLRTALSAGGRSDLG